MGINNSLSREISYTEQKSSYDAACKKLLSNKVILAHIMKGCIAEYKDCAIEDIIEKYIIGEPDIAGVPVHMDEHISAYSVEDTSIDEGVVTYDIRFTALLPDSMNRVKLIINIEAQNDFYPGYPIIKRGIYYCCRLISSQYNTEFIEAHYEKIKKVYSIWICNNPPKNRQNSLNKYHIIEDNVVGNVLEKVENYDLLTAIVLCLGSKSNEGEGILHLLEVLLSSERKADEKKQILEEEFLIPMTSELEGGISNMCNLSDGVEAIGIEKGLAQGREQGLEQGKLHVIQKLIEAGSMTFDQIMDSLEISEEEREEYRRKLAE